MKTPPCISSISLFVNLFFSSKAKTVPYQHFLCWVPPPQPCPRLSMVLSLLYFHSSSSSTQQSLGLRQDVWLLLCKKLLKGCTLATHPGSLELCFLVTSIICQELWGLLSRMVIPPACEEGLPQTCSQQIIPNGLFPNVPCFTFPVTEQDCWRAWPRFPLIS